MLQRLKGSSAVERALKRIAELLEEGGEWFYVEKTPAASARLSDDAPARRREAYATRDPPDASSHAATLSHGDASLSTGDAAAATALRKGEWEVRAAHGSLFLSVLTGRGLRVWRIAAWEWTGERLVLEATRRMGAGRALLELTPRASASAAREMLLAARRDACERLAVLANASAATGAKVERVALSRGARRGEAGRYAHIVLSTRDGGGVAVTGTVADFGSHETDAFLSSALVWFARLEERRRDGRPLRLWLVVTRNISEATLTRLALLRDGLRRVVSVYLTDDARETLTPLCVPQLDELLAAAPRFPRPAGETPLSRTAQEIIALAPEAIDLAHARHGETLRFHGLAFARVRRLKGREQVWFGVEGAATRRQPRAVGVSHRRLLDDDNRTELLRLVGELVEHRRAGADNTRHALYTAAPEAWLESILRRDISRLDPGLRLSPLHMQFRTPRESHAAARPIDLLALRQDGRLVVVELKVSEDATLPLQGADYWRRISTYNRAGHIEGARLFSDAEISHEPPLVYLVAPGLRFHRSFATLAHYVSPEIEMYRFDLNEDWRAGVRVARRCDLT